MKQEAVIVIAGAAQNTRYEINGQLTIGRNPDSGLFIDDLQISRKHAVIEQTPAGTTIRDLGSGNGTFVGDRRILEQRLAPGDIIKLGTLELQFESTGEEPEEVEGAEGAEGTEGTEGDRLVRFEEEDTSMTLQASSAKKVYNTFFAAPQEAVNMEQLKSAQSRLAAVYEANQIISSERDLKKLFERVIDQIFSLTPAHNGVILLKDETTDVLQTEYTKCGTGANEVVISTTIVKRAYDNGEAVLTLDAADDSRFKAGASIISQNISSAMCTPLRHQDATLGVVYVDTRGTKNAFEQGDLELLVALSGPAAIAIRNAQFLQELEQAYHDTLVVTANAIEMRDHYTVGHTWRVTNFAVELARELGWDDEQLKICEMGGVLHDVGKIAVKDAVLSKPSRLTDEEYAMMKVHPERGAEMMRDVNFLKPLIPYCLYHHERYDGNGYPHSLKGEDIPIEGRVVSVADTFDAMTSSRPYRKGLDPEIAIEELEKGRGTQFDPACVDAFIKCYRDGKIDRILQDYHAKDDMSIACPFCSTFIKPPEDAKVGDIIECKICHRRVRLMEKNDAYYGELVREGETATSE